MKSWGESAEPRAALALVILSMAGFLCGTLTARSAVLAHPEVDALNARVGTQIFSPRYHFTTNTALVEAAEAIQSMHSDVIKIYLGKGMAGQYGISLSSGIDSLTAMARSEPSVKRVLDMPFRHILAWTYCLSAAGDSWWKDGYSASERQKEYDELFAFSSYLLTNYNHSGKSFYLGHWEGDWYLLNNYVTTNNPSPTAVAGMIDWLNNRQQAVDDAMRTVPHANVAVYHYTEANRVRDAMVNGPESNVRLVNAVLPAVTNIDFVSWSSYDGMHLGQTELHATLNYIEAQLPTNKASVIAGRRVLIGEYGWGGSRSSADQEPITRSYMQKLLPWAPRFILFWQMYNNEPDRAYWLIDSNAVKTPCYFLHERLINLTKISAARFREANGRMPSESELAGLLVPGLAQALPAAVPFTVANRRITALSGHAASVQGSVQQNVYGDQLAAVGVCWGRTDGGTNRTAWEFSRMVGTNTLFSPAIFDAQLNGLAPATNYWYRFFATNETSEGWAPASGRFRTEVLEPGEYGARARITFPGYDRGEPLAGFPALVVLGTNIPGFSYRQFASGDGGDLRFTDSTGVQIIPHEIEEWNTNGASYVWVRLPLLETPADEAWAYWGNPLNGPEASNTNGTVWNPGSELVWHLREGALPFRDSALKHHAIAGDAPTPLAAGVIGRASLFNGTSDFLMGGLVSLSDRFTLSAWLRVDPSANSIQTIWANKAGGSTVSGVALFVHSYNSRDQKLILETGNGTLGSYSATDVQVVNTGRWCQVAAVVDRPLGQARLYVDGVERSLTTDARSDFTTQAALFAGRFAPSSTYFFRGAMDELRIDSELRSANWIWASWMNAASNAIFQSCASVDRTKARLACEPRSGSLAFSWAASGVGLRLWFATNLTQAAWELLADRPALVDNLWEIKLPGEGDSPRFFRLQSFD